MSTGYNGERAATRGHDFKFVLLFSACRRHVADVAFDSVEGSYYVDSFPCFAAGFCQEGQVWQYGGTVSLCLLHWSGLWVAISINDVQPYPAGTLAQRTWLFGECNLRAQPLQSCFDPGTLLWKFWIVHFFTPTPVTFEYTGKFCWHGRAASPSGQGTALWECGSNHSFVTFSACRRPDSQGRNAMSCEAMPFDE